jgi:hypothetical protein
LTPLPSVQSPSAALTAPIEQTTQVKTRQTPNFDDDPIVITQFYYSHALPYLMQKHHQEIGRRLKDVPSAVVVIDATYADYADRINPDNLMKMMAQCAEQLLETTKRLATPKGS